MEEGNRTAKVSVMLTPALLARLDRWAAAHRWTRSTAVAELLERGLSADGKQGDGHK